MQDPLAPGSAIYKLLYTDEHGEEVGLQDVQWLESIPQDRLAATQDLLRHDNLSIRFQAALILTAWGQDSGLAAIEDFIAQAGRDDQNLSPHRITGQDNRFDDMADAIRIYVISEGHRDRAVAALRGLLKLYPDHFFESSLKWALKDFTQDGLATDIAKAIERCDANGRPFQASQLLPILARIDAQAARALLPRFTAATPQSPDPMSNVAETLGVIHDPAAIEMLKQYANHPSSAVAEVARTALEQHARRG